MRTHLLVPALAWAALLRLGGAPFDVPDPASTAPAITEPGGTARSPIERLLRRALGRPALLPEEHAPDPDEAADPLDPIDLSDEPDLAGPSPPDAPEEEPR